MTEDLMERLKGYEERLKYERDSVEESIRVSTKSGLFKDGELKGLIGQKYVYNRVLDILYARFPELKKQEGEIK